MQATLRVTVPMASFAAMVLLASSVAAQTPPPEESAEETPEAPDAEEGAAAVDDDLDKLIEEASSEDALSGWADRQAERTPVFPRFEHHGYFRFRADRFTNGHLGTYDTATGTATSGIPAPLVANAINTSESAQGDVGDPDEDSLASANLRFRYQPTFHLSRSLRIRAAVDVLDNLVMGSTPDYAGYGERYDVPLVAFSGSQAPPEAGTNGFRDGIRVKEAYAEWQPAFLLKVGRMSSHWGLGILANGGQGIDADYGDYADRALIALKMYGAYVVGATDFVSSGAISDDPGDLFGQPTDLGEADDVDQFIISIFQRPLSADEKRERTIRFREDLEPVFDWGLYTVFRSQELDLSSTAYASWQAQGGVDAYDDLDLVRRKASAIIPDLWLRYQRRFDYDSGIRVEFEGVGIFGQIDDASDGDSTPRERKLEQFGAALEVEYDTSNLFLGLDAGFASGDSADGFGVKDKATIVEKTGQGTGVANTEVTNFKFDRNYHVDLLLFREVIGTVTNAIYIKPYIAYDLFDSVEEALGVRLDLMWAEAVEADATPGDQGHLGMEADLRLFYGEKGRFNLDIEGGLLFPGPAFDNLASNPIREADTAYSIQTRITLQF